MENRKILFKSQQRVLSPRNHIQINRERQRVTRTMNREKRFQSNRNISLSPKPLMKVEAREGQKPNCASGTAANAAQENRLQDPQKNEGSTSAIKNRHELYLQRFMKWREAAKRQPSQNQENVNPSSALQQTSIKENPQKRRSLYVAVDLKTAAPLPNKHIPDVKKLPAGIKALTAVAKPLSNGPLVSASIRLKASKTNEILVQKPLKDLKKTETYNSAKTSVKLEAPKTAGRSDHNAQRPLNLRTQPFNVHTDGKKVVIPLQKGGAASKFKQAARMRLKNEFSSQLTKRMKAKNAITNGRKQEKRISKQDLLQACCSLKSPEKSLHVTANSNLFLAQATSTQCKSNNSSADMLEAYDNIAKISPVTVTPKSSAKRQLLTMKWAAEQPKWKFNFVRYSEINTSIVSPLETPSPKKVLQPEEDDMTMLPKTPPKKVLQPEEDDMTMLPKTPPKNVLQPEEDDMTMLPKTPPKKVLQPEEDDMTMLPKTPPREERCEPNYLSPFVSVSRGKVNSRAEREKRNSMYLQGQDEEKPETPIAVRQTLESVKYFRSQLSNEVKRLHSLCDEWQLYSNQNEDLLQKTGGMDMIDAAIGQTKLLTSKKLMQFRGLIDRCEAGATGIGLSANDGSESTKPVLVEDLEGWWDMMRLQSDNLDKRFNNLMRWKANDWVDPDAAELPKSKPNPQPKTKKKSTAKASSNIKDFLRKAYEENQKNKASECMIKENSHFNISAKRRSLHRTILVRDHKSLSPARTLLRIPSHSNKRSSNAGNILLKSAILGATEEISRKDLTPTGKRTSILKTPGTIKKDSCARSVVFSAKKKVRRFQFTFDEGNLSGEEDDIAGVEKLEDCEEDMSAEMRLSQGEQSRIYGLRNRKVVLRPSSDFM